MTKTTGLDRYHLVVVPHRADGVAAALRRDYSVDQRLPGDWVTLLEKLDAKINDRGR